MRMIVLCLVATLALPAVAAASVLQPWVGVSGSWAPYAMTDVNRDIGDLSAALGDSGLAAQMNEIGHGFGLRVVGGLDATAGFTLTLAYQRLFASSHANVGLGDIAYTLPANAYSVGVQYRLASRGESTVSLCLGGGRVVEAGGLASALPGIGRISADFKGHGPLLEAFATGEWPYKPPVALSISAGWRHARVREVRVFDQILYNADGSKFTVDYSGFLLGVGVKLRLTK